MGWSGRHVDDHQTNECYHIAKDQPPGHRQATSITVPDDYIPPNNQRVCWNYLYMTSMPRFVSRGISPRGYLPLDGRHTLRKPGPYGPCMSADSLAGLLNTTAAKRWRDT